MTLTNRKALFLAGAFCAVELRDRDLPALQKFFEENPEYYLLVSGQPPRPDEAYQEMHEPLPDGWAYTGQWIVGFADKGGGLVGVANVISDFLAPGVWHIGFFLIATKLHGSGAAAALYGALEDWMRAQGATWLRLGVVDGNERGGRFWKGRGYVEVRKRANVPLGLRINTISVRVKPLAGGTIASYLQMIERDRPA